MLILVGAVRFYMPAKTQYNKIKNSFNSAGYILLTRSYKNNKQKLDYICSEGHKHSMAWNHWQEGHRCLKCVPIENSKRFRMDFDVVKDSFDGDGYILLTDHYLNAHQQLNYICPINST